MTDPGFPFRTQMNPRSVASSISESPNKFRVATQKDYDVRGIGFQMASSQPDEERFKAHIRQLLFHYAKTYLTMDYVEWTENAVLELLQQFLRDIPDDDPASLWLPQDPFDTLARRYSFSTLTAYEERWLTKSHALALIKESLAGLSRKTRSEKASFFDDYDMRYPERMSSMLTIRTVRNTHKFPSHPSAVTTQKTPFVVIESISEVGDEEPPLQMERTLNVKWGFHTTIREEVRRLLSETLNFPARDISSCRDWSLSKDDCSAQPTIEGLEWPFVPLFPRNRRPGSQTIDSTQTTKPESFAELQKNILPQIPTEKLDLDLFRDDMRVIDNWGASQVSSPTTLATLTSSQEDRKIDQLFIGSSPDTDPCPIEIVEATKMETVQMPRSRRLGGIPEGTKSITEGHSFTSFVLQQLPVTKEPETSCSLLQECASSLAGQAPNSGLHAADLWYEDEDRTLCSLYASVDPKDVWQRETLDEKDMMLMEVPTLPPPNAHPPGLLFLPSSFSDFAPGPGEQGAVHRFLRKVKGLQPLRVALSWMAFTTNEPLPTNAQVVSCCFTETELLTNGIPIGAIRVLLDGIVTGEKGRQYDMTADFGLFGERTSTVIVRFTDCVPDIVLTRRERRRRAGEPDPGPEPATVTEDVSKMSDIIAQSRDNNSRAAKKLKLHQNSQASSVTNVSPNLHDSHHKLAHFPSHAFENSDSATKNDTTKDNTTIRHSPRPSFVPENATDTSTAPKLQITTAGTTILGYNHNTPSTTAYHEARVLTYARLRLRTVSAPTSSIEDPSIYPDILIPAEESVIRIREAPVDIFDNTTLQLPPDIKQTATCHRYMASINMLQKRVLVRILATAQYSIELVERDHLGGADLIVDPFTSIIYASLFSLPAQCEDLISRISKLSWIHKRLIVILEGYPPAAAIKPLDETSDSLFAYSPPILKAIKKLRRGVDMAEAVGEKCETTLVLYAFPNTVNEAAAITRYIGDLSEDADETNGACWGDRIWMDEMAEDEGILAKAAGMNQFTAALILSQVTLADFIEMTAEQRQDTFGLYVGSEAIAAFNADLNARMTDHRLSDETMLEDCCYAIDSHGLGIMDDMDMDTNP